MPQRNGLLQEQPDLFRRAHADYREERERAVEIDRLLGFHAEEIEASLEKKARDEETTFLTGQQAWIGLPLGSLQTPHSELLEACELLAPEPGSSVVDLGAAYGRLGIVLGHHFPEVRFTGFELVPERADEANRIFEILGCARAKVWQRDISSDGFELPDARYFFIYDYGRPEPLRRTLEQLKDRAQSAPLSVIGRGRMTRTEIERHHPWLSEVIPPLHRPNYSIYRSHGVRANLETE